MSGSFEFEPCGPPFPRWMGPFSPARGNRSGFRLHGGRLGTWVGDDAGMSFWSVVDGAGARRLARVVSDSWGGGRVLLLPDGLVVKPLQQDHEVGRRALIGRFCGAILLETDEGGIFDLGRPDVKSGSLWPGPATIGLECVIQRDGSLDCRWHHPSDSGRETEQVCLRGPDARLAAAFRAARPHDEGGRVRVTALGHVTTNRQRWDNAWEAVYLAHLEQASWTGWEQWIEGSDP